MRGSRRETASQVVSTLPSILKAAGRERRVLADRVSSSSGEADARPGVTAGSANLDTTRLLLRSRTDEPSQG